MLRDSWRPAPARSWPPPPGNIFTTILNCATFFSFLSQVCLKFVSTLSQRGHFCLNFVSGTTFFSQLCLNCVSARTFLSQLCLSEDISVSTLSQFCLNFVSARTFLSQLCLSEDIFVSTLSQLCLNFVSTLSQNWSQQGRGVVLDRLNRFLCFCISSSFYITKSFKNSQNVCSGASTLDACTYPTPQH